MSSLGDCDDSALPWSGLAFIQGEPLTAAQALGRHIVVLEQWATWCPPCRTSIPHLNALSQRFHKHGVRFIGVTSETDRPKLLKFIAGQGKNMTYAVAVDDNAILDDWDSRYRAQGIPHAFVLDWNGRVRWSGHPMTGLEAKLDTLVNEFKQWQAKQGHGADGQGDEAKAAALRALSDDALQAKSVTELMREMKEAGMSTAGCIEKSDLIARIHGKTLG